MLKLFIFIFALALPLGEARADVGGHGLSLFGAPKLEKGFAHFPYVNPNAPKGGRVRIAAIGSFDNLNPFTIKGNTAAGVALIHDSLLATSLDEPSAAYGLIAESVSVADDFSSVTFTLREAARFSDGSVITAEDVAFSLEAIRAAHPFYRAYYGDVASTEILGAHKIRFVFKKGGNRELPLILGQLPVLSKNYWQSGERGLDKTTLEPPVVSGAYAISRVEAGRSIHYLRRDDYWGGELNVNRGRHNFAEIIYEYFGDDTIAFEALKAGDIDYRYEFSSRLWATGYDSPAVKRGDLVVKEIALKTGAGMQAFVFNLRRARFADARVRRALNLAFDFEWTNKNLFYGQYARNASFFERSELAAKGKPSAAELKLLEPLRALVPESVFDVPPENPKSDGSGNIRANLRSARALLQEAGWELVGSELKREGEVFTIEFLIVQPAFERVIAPYIQNLAKLGIAARLRVVDSSQYQNRLTEYDFDAIVSGWGQSLSPGNEQRNYWSSAAADIPGGRNYAGIKDEAVDSLIDALIGSETRAELVAATRALDRVLLANHYVVPQWYAPHERIAFWKRLAHPPPPAYGLGFPDIWWARR